MAFATNSLLDYTRRREINRFWEILLVINLIHISCLVRFVVNFVREFVH